MLLLQLTVFAAVRSRKLWEEGTRGYIQQDRCKALSTPFFGKMSRKIFSILADSEVDVWKGIAVGRRYLQVQSRNAAVYE
jgi:hypothetical protein